MDRAWGRCNKSRSCDWLGGRTVVLVHEDSLTDGLNAGRISLGIVATTDEYLYTYTRIKG